MVKRREKMEENKTEKENQNKNKESLQRDLPPNTG